MYFLKENLMQTDISTPSIIQISSIIWTDNYGFHRGFESLRLSKSWLSEPPIGSDNRECTVLSIILGGVMHSLYNKNKILMLILWIGLCSAAYASGTMFIATKELEALA